MFYEIERHGNGITLYERENARPVIGLFDTRVIKSAGWTVYNPDSREFANDGKWSRLPGDAKTFETIKDAKTEIERRGMQKCATPAYIDTYTTVSFDEHDRSI